MAALATKTRHFDIPDSIGQFFDYGEIEERSRNEEAARKMLLVIGSANEFVLELRPRVFGRRK